MLWCISEHAPFWVRSPFNKPDFKLSYKSTPTKKNKRLILLRDLGHGTSGRVWMVYSTSGKVGALKFLQAATNKKLHKELSNWNRLYGKGFLAKLKGYVGLLMLYARPLNETSNSYSSESASREIKDTVYAFVKGVSSAKD